MNEPTRCPTHQLGQLLSDQIDEPTRLHLIEHLDDCPQCRHQMDRLAAPQNEWNQITAALSEPPCVESLGDPSDGLGGQEHEVPNRPQESFTEWMKLLSPSDNPRAAGRLGPFEITGVIGSGGMGIVLKARDPALDRYVAIKALSPHLATSQTARLRFDRESRAAAGVVHENVIAIYQVAQWQGLPYLVMPYVSGPSLQQRIDQDGRVNLEACLLIGMQIARGLAAAHAQGLVHRDVKPANILLSGATERAVITDFGLARAADDASLTRSGTLLGTPHYMSPEQARGESFDHRSDLFSLGSVLFAMHTGRPPIDMELGSDVVNTVATASLPTICQSDPDAPAWWSRLISCLHEPLAKDRPDTAAEVTSLLEQCLAHVRSPDRHAIPDQLTNSSTSKTKSLRIFVAVALLVASLLACVWRVHDRVSPSTIHTNSSKENDAVSFPQLTDPVREIDSHLDSTAKELLELHDWLDNDSPIDLDEPAIGIEP